MEAVIERGLRRHIEALRARQGAGERRLGFKVGFNAKTLQQSLGLPYSVVAGLTRSTLLDAGADHSLQGAVRPALEGEVVARLSRDVRSGDTAQQVAAAVASLAPAIEVVDLDRPLEEVEAILADGVFHRALLLGEPVAVDDGSVLAGVNATVSVDGGTHWLGDAEQASGKVADVLLHVATLLEAAGEGLRAGDAVILGSMAPLVFPEPGTRFGVALDGFGQVSLQLTA